jgi:hypothetical protein
MAFWSFGRLWRCLAMLGVLALLGCDSNPTLHSLIDTGPDSCRDQRNALRSYGDYFAQNMVVGAAAGAATAGIAAAVTHQSVGTTVAMIAAGFTIGAAAGYWKTVSDKNANTAARFRAINSDVQAENKKVDGAQQAFNRLLDCRRKQAAQLRADVAAGRVSRADGTKQMEQIKARYADDVEIGKRINANMADHAVNLEYASEQLKPQPYVTIAPTNVYAAENAGSAKLSSFKSDTTISGAAVDKNWIKVTLTGGRTGFVQAGDVELQSARLAKDKKTRHAAPAAAKGDPVAEGVFTNLSKRADFDDSVQVAASNTSGFELSGG